METRTRGKAVETEERWKETEKEPFHLSTYIHTARMCTQGRLCVCTKPQLGSARPETRLYLQLPGIFAREQEWFHQALRRTC